MYYIHELTVAELIELLKECPQDAKVKFEWEDEWAVTSCETRTYDNGNSTVYLGAGRQWFEKD